MTATEPTTNNRRRIHVPGPRPDIRVPVVEVRLADSPDGSPNQPVHLYDTSGPGSDPTQGLEPLRLAWIEERNDTEVISGRNPAARDDGG